MANIAISALPAVTTPLAGTEILPAVQSSATKRVTIAQIASYIGSYTLPVATASVLGGVKQGTNTTIAADGTISVATGAGYSYTLPVATASVLGGVKQGTNITIDANGVISASGGSATATIQNKTAAYTVVVGDLGKIINCTSGTFTVALTAAATLGVGFTVTIWNTSTTSTDAITIDPNGSETIDGKTTRILRRGEGMQIVCDGTNWQSGSKKAMLLYAENMDPVNSTLPQAIGDRAFAIGPNNTANGIYSSVIGYNNTANGTADFVAGSSSSTGSGGYAIAINGDANSANSTAIGHNSGVNRAVAAGSGAVALGGSYASGQNSFAAGIGNNSSSYGAKNANAIALGNSAVVTGLWAVAIGYLASASASTSIALGRDTEASGTSSMALNGGKASAERSMAAGRNAKAEVVGKYAYSGEADFGATSIYSQQGTYVLICPTTNATPGVLTTNNTTASAINQIIIQNNSAYAFTGTIIARQQAAGGNDFAAWEIKGGIVRGATASTTVLGTYNINTLSKSAGAAAWTIALSADTTNGGLAITVTGAAAVNIRWVATVQTTEVTYA